MNFDYDYYCNKSGETIYFIDFSYDDLVSEKEWDLLRDLVAALKIRLDYLCHIELAPLKDSIEKFHTLYPDNPILRIEIYPETWKIKKKP